VPGATQKPKIGLQEVDSSVLAAELEELANRVGIDLSLANDEETERILNNLSESLSDEIVEAREKYE
jgi:hypothetical protein